MPGGQSRGLVQASKTKGWDPTRIEGFGSIANFDKDPGNLPGDRVGRIPGGTPDGWPDGYDVEISEERTTFATPDHGKGSRRRGGK